MSRDIDIERDMKICIEIEGYGEIDIEIKKDRGIEI